MSKTSLLRAVFIILCIVFISSCSPTKPASIVPSEAVPTSTAESDLSLTVPSQIFWSPDTDFSNADMANFNLPSGWYAERIYRSSMDFAEAVAVSPSGTIVVFERCDVDSGHHFIQIIDRDTVAPYGPDIDRCFRGMDFDAESNLYGVDHEGALFKITPQGEISEVAQGVKLSLAFGPSGNLYAAGDNQLQRIAPQGEISVIATGFNQAETVVVSPVTEELFVYDKGTHWLYHVHEDGSLDELLDLKIEYTYFFAFAPDGQLYLSDPSRGTFIINTQDVSLTELPWIWEMGSTKYIDFDSQGRIVNLIAGNNGIFRIDLETKAYEDIYNPTSTNKGGLALAPDGGLYKAVESSSNYGEGRIVRFEKDGSITTILNELPPEIPDLVFDADGVLYLSTIQRRSGSEPADVKIMAYRPDGELETLITFDFYVWNLAIDPTTGYLWGTEGKKLWYLDENNDVHFVPLKISTHVPTIAFTADGTLYASIDTNGVMNIPQERGLYRIDPDGPTLIADTTTINLSGMGSFIMAGFDGNIYYVADGDAQLPEKQYDFFILQITPEGETTLFARHLPVDPIPNVASLDSMELYFASGLGIYRLFQINK